MSKEGDGLGVAHKMVQQGTSVDFWIKEPRFAMAGQGIVNRVDSWRSSIAKADLVICDMVGFGQLEETLRTIGKPAISCSQVLEQAELKRSLGMQLFHVAGIAIPDTYQCSGREEARATTAKLPWETGWVIKPDGNKATAKTLAISDQEEWDWALSNVDGPLIVQRIVKGIEISTEGWFNGRDFIRPFTHTFEEKKFLNDNLGQATGCMGNIVLRADSNKLTRATVERLKPFLSSIGYRGPVDVNCIVAEDAARALEITSRLGYDAIEAMAEGLREPIIDLFFECAVGTKKEMLLGDQTMMAVRLSVPPWPIAKPKEENRGEPVLGLDEKVLKHVAATDLYLKGGAYYTAGGDGVLLKATAVGGRNGDDLTREAARRCYRTLESIRVSNKQYRTDIGARVNSEWKQLKAWGWV